jgi:3',5'-cyclic AMP phosphodiesterase CpdA
MGDSRGGNDVLSSILHAINADPTIRFSLNKGDLVSRGREDEFTEYARIIAQAKRPLINIIGNHETYAPGKKSNDRMWFGAPYFSPNPEIEGHL